MTIQVENADEVCGEILLPWPMPSISCALRSQTYGTVTSYWWLQLFCHEVEMCACVYISRGNSVIDVRPCKHMCKPLPPNTRAVHELRYWHPEDMQKTRSAAQKPKHTNTARRHIHHNIHAQSTTPSSFVILAHCSPHLGVQHGRNGQQHGNP